MALRDMANWVGEWTKAARRQPVFLLAGVTLIFAIVAADAFLISYLRSRAIVDASRETRNLAYVLAEQTDRSLQSVRIVTRNIADFFENMGLASAKEFEVAASDQDVTKLLRDRISGLQHVNNINLTSARGILVNRTRPGPPPPLDLSKSEILKHALAAKTNDLIITDPFRSVTTGAWAFMLAKRVTAANGETIGLVSAIVELSSLEELYSKVLLLGPNGSISIQRSDGVLLARHPRSEQMIGVSLAGREAYKALAEQGLNAVIQARSPVDGSDRIIAAFTTPNFPILMVVTSSLDDVLREWRQNRAALIFGGVIACLGVVFCIILLARSTEDLSRARTALAVAREREVAQKAEQAQQAKFVHLARHDALTGLPNRMCFREELAARLRAIDAGEQIAVHYIDLDRFKAVNDTFGHPIGDELLVQVAKRLSTGLRSTDLLARLGGDEFAVIQLLARGRADAVAFARRMTTQMQQPFNLTTCSVVVGASIGISVAPEDADEVDEAVKNADLALYAAKEKGRGGFEFFTQEMGEATKTRLTIEQELRAALIDDQFELHFQPQILLHTGDITGFEALVRWRHPTRGIVGPCEFIPIAEETSLIGSIGEWVIREACRTAARWPKRLRVAINVSAAQFKTTDVARAIADALEESSLAPERLEIEVTESVMLNESAAALPSLQAIQRMGVSIAMDDFGTGYSSLSCLTLFPFDKLKIDKSFVGALGSRDDCSAIVRSATGLARSLDMKTIAEGIETVRHLLEARALGCSEGQGFLFGAPMPANEVDALIEDGELSIRLA